MHVASPDLPPAGQDTGGAGVCRLAVLVSVVPLRLPRAALASLRQPRLVNSSLHRSSRDAPQGPCATFRPSPGPLIPGVRASLTIDYRPLADALASRMATGYGLGRTAPPTRPRPPALRTDNHGVVRGTPAPVLPGVSVPDHDGTTGTRSLAFRESNVPSDTAHCPHLADCDVAVPAPTDKRGVANLPDHAS